MVGNVTFLVCVPCFFMYVLAGAPDFGDLGKGLLGDRKQETDGRTTLWGLKRSKVYEGTKN